MLGGTTSGSVSCRGGAGSIGATTSTRFGKSISGGGDPGRNGNRPPSADVTASFDNVKTSGVCSVSIAGTAAGTPGTFGAAGAAGGASGGGGVGSWHVAAA